jgi:hypothetical protein
MSRTFSIRWLLIGVTVVCICSGIAAIVPEELFGGLFWFYGPAVVVSFGLATLWSQRVSTLTLMLAASFLGGLIGAALFTHAFGVIPWSDGRTAWEFYRKEIMPIQASAVGAAVLAGVLWIRFLRRKRSHQGIAVSKNEQTHS